jgi:hypothetical protein
MNWWRVPFEDRRVLIAKYRQLVLPRSSAPLLFHVRNRFGMWIRARWPDTGHEKFLGDGSIDWHLRGKALYASVWRLKEQRVRTVVIDLDNKTQRPDPGWRSAQRDFNARFAAVLAALAPARPLIIRSSSSGGLHLYLFLRRPYRAERVRQVVAARLREQGIDLIDGQVELWPNNRPLRLPLGQGSHLLDARFRLQHARRSGSRIVRDVPASIQALVVHAEANSVSLRSLGVDLYKRESLAKTEVKRTAAVRTGGGASYRDDILASEDGIPQHHTRWRIVNRRLFHLRVERGLSHADALIEFGRWLRDEHHVSRDLERDRDGTIRSLLKFADGCLAGLDARITRGDLRVGNRGAGGGFGALSLYLDSLRQGHPDDWRAAARSRLTRADIRRLAKLADPRTREHAGIVLGVLRWGFDQDRPVQRVTLAARSLMSICGGRTRPVLDHRLRRVRFLAVSAYQRVVRALTRLGLITLEESEIVGRRARLFSVRLPGRRPPPP